MECACGAKMRNVKTQLSLFDGEIVLNNVDAVYCPDCNEEIMTTEQAAEAQRRLKEALPNFEAFQISKKITRVGNSLTVPLSKELADYMNLKKGQEVRITLKNRHRLVLDVA